MDYSLDLISQTYWRLEAWKVNFVTDVICSYRNLCFKPLSKEIDTTSFYFFNDFNLYSLIIIL